jgi:competence protein ComEA
VGSKLHFAPVVILALSAALAQETPGQLPDGKGKEAVERICTGCHEIGTVTGSRRTRIGWQRNVDDMIARGAEGSDEDMETVVDYLTAFFGKINVNTAASKELASFLGLSETEAQAIVSYRERNGKYKDFEQLRNTPGVSAEKLQAKRAQIAFSL